MITDDEVRQVMPTCPAARRANYLPFIQQAMEEFEITTYLRKAAFLAQCLAWGKQYRLQRRIRSTESVSKVLFEAALRLARNRDLVESNAPGLAARRRAFADELRDAIRRIDAIGTLAASRLAGLIE